MDYYFAAFVILLSGLTDMLDGYVARKYDMITELGKVLDPIADKLTQGALFICLSIRYPLMRWIVGLFVIKEGTMGIVGFLMLKRNGRKLDGAKWFGKVCTASLYLVMFILILLPGLSITIVNTLIVICGILLLAAFVLYMRLYAKMWKKGREV